MAPPLRGKSGEASGTSQAGQPTGVAGSFWNSQEGMQGVRQAKLAAAALRDLALSLKEKAGGPEAESLAAGGQVKFTPRRKAIRDVNSCFTLFTLVSHFFRFGLCDLSPPNHEPFPNLIFLLISCTP